MPIGDNSTKFGRILGPIRAETLTDEALNQAIGRTMQMVKKFEGVDKDAIKTGLAHFNVARQLLRLGYPQMARAIALFGERHILKADHSSENGQDMPERLSPEDHAKLSKEDVIARRLKAGYAGRDAYHAGQGSWLDKLGDAFGRGNKKSPKRGI